MKKSWILPACFLIIAALTNFVARAIGNAEIAAMVKPALLPLIALVTVTAVGGINDKVIKSLVTAQLLGGFGDILLISSALPAFGAGLGCFLAGHIFYISIFGKRTWKGLTMGQWLIALAVIAFCVAGLLVGIGVKGMFLVPFAVYGSVLMFLIFSGFAGVIRKIGDTKTWWIITCGAVLFAFSDSLIAVQTFNSASVLLEFLVMLTYVIAQCLLAWGGIRISEAEKGQA